MTFYFLIGQWRSFSNKEHGRSSASRIHFRTGWHELGRFTVHSATKFQDGMNWASLLDNRGQGYHLFFLFPSGRQRPNVPPPQKKSPNAAPAAPNKPGIVPHVLQRTAASGRTLIKISAFFKQLKLPLELSSQCTTSELKKNILQKVHH